MRCKFSCVSAAKRLCAKNEFLRASHSLAHARGRAHTRASESRIVTRCLISDRRVCIQTHAKEASEMLHMQRHSYFWSAQACDYKLHIFQQSSDVIAYASAVETCYKKPIVKSNYIMVLFHTEKESEASNFYLVSLASDLLDWWYQGRPTVRTVPWWSASHHPKAKGTSVRAFSRMRSGNATRKSFYNVHLRLLLLSKRAFVRWGML